MSTSPVAGPAGPSHLAISETLASTFEHEIGRDHPPNLLPAVRDAHPKTHGCVEATFRIEKHLPIELEGGVFVPGREYTAWIRFSNALKVRHDLVRDARGMAIKLLSVATENETPGCTSQDFLLVTHQAFFVKDADQYVDFPATVFKVRPLIALYVRVARFFFGISPPRFRWRGAWALLRSQKWTSSPLVLPYFSQVPFHMGPNGHAKFCVVPRQGPGIGRGLSFFLLVLAYLVPMPARMKDAAFGGSKNLLHDRLQTSLTGGRSASFDFCVQLRSDPARMPLDDATVAWGRRGYKKVATIEIGPQQAGTDERMKFGEHLSYSPWHALPAHKPEGSINEVRRVVYRRTAALRHALNGVALRDPRPGETPTEFLKSIAGPADQLPVRD